MTTSHSVRSNSFQKVDNHSVLVIVFFFKNCHRQQSFVMKHKRLFVELIFCEVPIIKFKSISLQST